MRLPRFARSLGTAALCFAVAVLSAQTTPATPAAAPAPAAPSAPAPDQPPRPPRARVSPHETTGAVIGDRRSGTRITITYGRPYTRDPKTHEPRKIWGGLVAWDKPDRLGADEATLLLTTTALKFGDTVIPAGAHTLYLVPSAQGTSKLVFSAALGKWGVPIDTTQDVARIDLAKHPLAESIDQLTIGVDADPAGTGGLLKIAWENTVFSAAFTVVK